MRIIQFGLWLVDSITNLANVSKSAQIWLKTHFAIDICAKSGGVLLLAAHVASAPLADRLRRRVAGAE